MVQPVVHCLVVLGTVLTRSRLDLHELAGCRNGAHRERPGAERQQAIQVDADKRKAPLSAGGEPLSVFGGDQLTNRRVSIADDMGRSAADYVEEFAVEEQQSIHLTRRLALEE